MEDWSSSIRARVFMSSSGVLDIQIEWLSCAFIRSIIPLTTSITNVKQNIKSDWLNGGATVWRREILRDNLHAEINSGWAVYEDLIFSYPVGKKYPLYISKDSKIEVDNPLTSDDNLQTYRYRGKTQCIWGAYFVSINQDMSISKTLCQSSL